MSWRTVRKNYRIEVTPAGSDGFHAIDDEHEARILLHTVDAAVRAHYRDGRGSVRLRFDEATVCSFCRAPRNGSELGADDCDQPGDVPGLPVCCEQAQAEFRAKQTGAGERA